MASLNVSEWTPVQVAEWLSGLGPTVEQYVPGLLERRLNGTRLLMLRCDDLEYLGVYVIGHQELILEAVEHLRNYQYEVSRECVQQLAVRVSAAATALVRALQTHADALETQALADVARLVAAVKPLVCWLERWAARGPLAQRRAALLALSLEAATCAQRDRFAERPTRAVAAAAAAIAAAADHLVQDVADPTVLQPASMDNVTLKQGSKPLGFSVVPSFCGHHQLAHIRFGSPAHASGAVHEGDEIVAVGGRCVVGWSGERVRRACGECASRGGELPLRLRRRGAPLAALRVRRVPPPAPVPRDSSSSDSEPASPTRLADHPRMYPPKPRPPPQRRHSVSCSSPTSQRPNASIEQFWQELKEHQWSRQGSDAPVDAEAAALYRREKAVSVSTGLELSPRPRTCLGVAMRRASPPAASPAPTAATPTPLRPSHVRGKLDKSHSTPAYDLEGGGAEAPSPLAPGPPAPSPLVTQTIPESPTDSHSEAISLPPETGTAKARALRRKPALPGRRREVCARAASARGAAGAVWQRVRGRGAGAGGGRWARRHLALVEGALFAFRSAHAPRAACRVRLQGFTVCAATEVKSRAHAFKVYHTGTAFYFAADARETMLAWIQLIHRATLLPSPAGDLRQVSETDYSETESDEEPPRPPPPKDKSKFGSLKKLAQRAQRSDSTENVAHAATSLDRKYLKFFSRSRARDDKSAGKQAERPEVAAAVPLPVRVVDAANLHVRAVRKPEAVLGFVTLEEFMLQKQEEERRQLGCQRKDRVQPQPQPRSRPDRPNPAAPRLTLALSGSRRDAPRAPHAPHPPRPTHPPHSHAQHVQLTPRTAQDACWGWQYPHLQCPPTFQPETYSLARLEPRRRDVSDA